MVKRSNASLLLLGAITPFVSQASFSRCDVNQDGNTNAAVVQLAVNEALGTAAAD